MRKLTILLPAMICLGCGTYVQDQRGNAVSLRSYTAVRVESVTGDDAAALCDALTDAVRRSPRWSSAEDASLRALGVSAEVLSRSARAASARVRVINSRSEKPLGTFEVDCADAAEPLEELARRIVEVLTDAGQMSPHWESGEMGCGC